jgi:hypothetical protein
MPKPWKHSEYHQEASVDFLYRLDIEKVSAFLQSWRKLQMNGLRQISDTFEGNYSSTDVVFYMESASLASSLP